MFLIMPLITLYTTSTCPFCKMQKEYMDAKGLHFQEILVDHDTTKAREMIAISGQMGVPFTVINKEDGTKVTILGFDQKKLEKELGISK